MLALLYLSAQHEILGQDSLQRNQERVILYYELYACTEDQNSLHSIKM